MQSILKRTTNCFRALNFDMPTDAKLRLTWLDKITLGAALCHEFDIELSADEVYHEAFEGSIEDTAKFVENFLKAFE